MGGGINVEEETILIAYGGIEAVYFGKPEATRLGAKRRLVDGWGDMGVVHWRGPRSLPS